MAGLLPDAIEHHNKHVTYMDAAKGSFLIKQGQHTNHLYIIEKGFARIFSIIKGKEITTLFARENDIITSTQALFTKTGSNENVEILEDSLLLKIDYTSFVNLCREHPDMFNLYSRYGRNVTDRKTQIVQQQTAYRRHYIAADVLSPNEAGSLRHRISLTQPKILMLRHPFNFSN